MIVLTVGFAADIMESWSRLSGQRSTPDTGLRPPPLDQGDDDLAAEWSEPI